MCNKLKHWFKRLWCWLTGCIFADINLESCYDERTYTFRNKCLRCGRRYKCEIAHEDIFDFEPKRWEGE